MKIKVPLFNHLHFVLPSLLKRGIKGVVIGTVPVFVLAFLILASYSHALIDLSIFGPKRYDRLKGAPTVYTDTFERCNPAQFAVLKIQNGGSKETRIKAASVYVNGVEVVKENEFKQFVPYIEKTVPVKDVNELKVVLKSGMQDDPNNKLMKEQSFLIIEVVGKGCDDTPPTISNPQPADGSLLNNGRPVISASYADNSAGTGIEPATASIKIDGSDVTSIASVSASGISYTPSSKLPEGEHTVAVSVSDKAHNASTLTWRFATDTVAPSVKITSHINNQFLNTPTISVSGTVSDELSGNPSGGVTVTVNGHSATVAGNTFTVSNLSLSEGADTITVTATDRAGNVGMASITINLDTISPVVSISSPNANAYLNTPQINISGSVNEPVTSLKVNGVNIGAVVQSPYEFTKEMTLAEGSNTINIEVVDRAGNVGSGQIAVTLDTIPPVINITAPIQDSFVNTQQIDVAGSVTELHPAGLWINDAAVSLNGLQFSTGLSLNEGPNTIKIKASDLAGNVSEASVSLTLDTVLPVVAIEAPVEGFLINNPQMGVAGSVNEPVTSLTINGSSVGANGGSPVLFESNYTVAEGLNTITVQAVDRAGNTGIASVKGTLDTKAPAVKITSHQNNQYLNTAAIVFTGTVSDDVTGNPAGGVVVTVNGVAAQVAGDSFNISNLSLSEGANTITVEAKDPAGNVGLDTIVINIDTTAPVISVTTPEQNSYSDLPNIKVTGAINEPVTSLTINGQVVTPDSSLLTSDFALDVTLVPGLNTINLKAIDLAGNVSTASVTVTLDSTPPVVTITAPASGSLVNKPGIKVTGTVNEPVNDITINGVSIGAVELVASGQGAGVSFNLENLTLSEGLNNIVVQAIDRAGNSGTATVSVTVDSIAPSAPVIDALNTPTNISKVTITGKAEAGSEVKVFASGNASQIIGTVDADSTGMFSIANVALTEGMNSFSSTATDAAGNTGTASQPVTVTLDTVAPVISVTTPAQNSYADLPNISVSGTVTDLHPAGFWINDAPVEATGQSPLQFSTGLTLVPGLNTINLKATDLAGNVSSASVTVTLDSTPPVVTITAPATGSLLNKMGVKVAGTVNEAVTSLTINGLSVGANGGSPVHYDSDLTLLEGLNNIVVQAIDRAGNSGTASVSVTVDSAAPDAPVLDSLSTPTKVSPVTIAGSSEAGSTVKVIRSASGAQEQIGTATADSQGRFSIQNVTLTEGPSTFTATATDAAGNTSGAASPVTVLLDTVPPAITVTAPANNSYTNVATVKVTGSLNEDASLTINGTETRAIGQSPLQFEKDITLTSGINSIQLTAKDAAGNQTTSTVLVTLDQTAPVVTITSPVSGAVVGSSTVTVTGTVNEPVTNLAINGVSVGAIGQSPAQFNANVTLQQGSGTITVEATDKAGNTGTATMQVSVDSMPPVVTLNAPSEVAAGATISISAGATDPSGVSLLEVLANGITIWSENQWSGAGGQGSVVYTLSPDLTTGTIINITAKATDATGLTGTATATITVSQGPTGPGYIQGEVYEDLRGLRLEGAEAVISTVGAYGDTPLRMTTQSDGGYFFEATAGDYLITISKAGYTTVERKITVKPEKNIAPLDARLTPISSTQNLIDANGGKISTTPTSTTPAPPYQGGELGIELTIPANALTEQADIRLTPVSNQGLMGVLPKGWSPIAAVDIKDNLTTGNTGKTFDQAATLKIPVAPGIILEPASQVVLAAYVGAYGDTPVQNPVHDWLVSSLGTVSSDGKFITASVPSTGQYAIIIPDQPLTSAPSASSAVTDVFVVSDSPINPLTDSPLFSATSKVKPAAAPPSVGLKAVGEVVITPSSSSVPSVANLVSGFVVNAKVNERFDLLSGEVETPSDYIQDIVLYRYPCVTNIGSGFIETTPAATDSSTTPAPPYQGGELIVRTTFPISPSRDYSIIELMMGKVGLEITLPESDLSGTVVGPEGARLVDSDGNVLNILQGVLTGSAPVEVKTIASSAITGIVGSDFTLLRAIDINLGGKLLSSSAELSIPAPQGINQNLPIVIARAIEVKGATKLKLVSLAKVSGSLITSVFPVSPVVQGIKLSGTYYFLQAKSSLGFVQGKVTDASNNPYTSTLVTSNTCSLVDLTGTDGNYLIASKVSTFIATAADIYRNDKGIASGTIASVNQTVTVNLTIKVIPPHIVSIAPDSGETAVDPKTSVIVTFSEAVDKNTVTSSNIYLKDSAGNTVSGVFSINPDGTEATLYPSVLLKSEASYTVTVTKSIRDLQGYLMGQDVTTTFKIKDLTPPPMPPAGSITGTFPDENGLVTITATQGSAEANATVLIINDTTGEIVSVTPQTNGSFTARITAQLGDEIKIVLMDAAGNQTLITYITFKSTDGKYLVTAKGGTIEGEGGTKLLIPEGALLGPAVVKITPVLEENLAQPVPDKGKFIAAVNIDTGGVKFQKEVKLSVPAPTNLPADAVPFASRPSEFESNDGTIEKVYEIIDSTKIINERLTTASWPFDGIVAAGTYVFAYIVGQPVIVHGTMYRDINGNGVTDDADLPIRGGIVRDSYAWSFIASTNTTGNYATYSWTFSNTCRDINITAIDPYTQKTQFGGGSICQAPYIYRKDFKFDSHGMPDSDKEAPRINITLASSKAFVAGTTLTGATLTITINVSDNYGLDRAGTSIVIDTPSGNEYPQLESPVATRKIENGVSREVLTYTLLYSPTTAGNYTIKVEAKDIKPNTATRTITFSVQDNDLPAPLPGRPSVIDYGVKPAPNSEGNMVTTKVEAAFTEPVDNVTTATFTLTRIADENGSITPEKVDGAVLTYVSDKQMKAAFIPSGNLKYASRYKITLSYDITDKDGEYLNAFESTFWTIKPATFGLAQDPFKDGKDIAVLGDKAYETAGTAGWKVIDIKDPTSPNIIYTENHTTASTVWSFRGVSAAPDVPITMMDGNFTDGPMAALTEDIMFDNGARYGMLRLYDISNPALPVIIGHQRLHSDGSGVPGKLAIEGSYAYVTSVGDSGGLQVVDLKKAQYPYAHDEAIIGFLNMQKSEPYYGTPMDIAILKGYAYLATIPGHFLTVDLGMPEMPIVKANIPASSSFQAVRVAVAGDYTYIDETGNPLTIDIAAVITRDGLRIIDITDPGSPSIIGTLGGIYAKDVTLNSKNGMVYVSTLNDLIVVDIKNPKLPRLIGTAYNTGLNQAIVEKDGWVYTANQQTGFKAVALNPLLLKLAPDSITLDNSGVPNTKEINYTILTPDITVTTASLNIYKNGAIYKTFTTAKQGSGKVDIADVLFDLTNTYYAQEILNAGTPDELKSNIVPIVPVAMIPDYNHDKKIDDEDKKRAFKRDKYYFWINDDDDSGETGGTDIPRTTNQNGENDHVDGVRDLVDFFPVYLNIKNLLNIFDPNTNSYVLKTEGENMNIVIPNTSFFVQNSSDNKIAVTDLMPDQAGAYLTNLTTATPFGDDITQKIKKSGIKLNSDQTNLLFMQKIKEQGKGIILVEGSKTGSSPLVLEIRDINNARVFYANLSVSLDEVEQMYRHKNLIKDGGGIAPDHGIWGGEPDRFLDANDPPKNYPDSETNGKNFVFLHGYNINGQYARGSQSELFKKLYWSGSKAKFWGISWYGFETQRFSMTENESSPNYHINVRHAFATSPKLAEFLNTTVKNTGGEITIAAHSLGNMVVSSAISDWGANVKNYLMIDAAVAMEAYDGGAEQKIDPATIAQLNPGGGWGYRYMEHTDWAGAGYKNYLFASEWHSLFKDTDDARNMLTWRNRFGNRSGSYYNFYSTGEEALAAHPYNNMPGIEDFGLGFDADTWYSNLAAQFGWTGIGSVRGIYAWALQEKLKGRMPSTFSNYMGSEYGGWGFNYEYRVATGQIMSPFLANQLTEADLKIKPFFFKDGMDDGLFIPGPLSAIDYNLRARLLADAIPALTLPAGANDIGETFGSAAYHNFNMQEKYQSGWPESRDTTKWRHNDVKDVAYIYTYGLFDKFMKIMEGLNQ